jgi:putative ABC transport system ATP-binding protein
VSDTPVAQQARSLGNARHLSLANNNVR